MESTLLRTCKTEFRLPNHYRCCNDSARPENKSDPRYNEAARMNLSLRRPSCADLFVGIRCYGMQQDIDYGEARLNYQLSWCQLRVLRTYCHHNKNLASPYTGWDACHNAVPKSRSTYTHSHNAAEKQNHQSHQYHTGL